MKNIQISLKNILQDPVLLRSKIKQFINSKSKSIIIYTEVTTICNNKCYFCPIDGVNNQRGQLYISEEVEDNVSAFIRSWPDKQFRIYFHLVGEPLLYQGLEGYIEKVDQPNAEVWMSTNGVFLSEARLKSLHEAGLRNIWFSMFGASEEEYKEFTFTNNFKKARESLERLLLKNDMFDNIHIVTFSKAIDPGIREIIKRKKNVTLQEDREMDKWEPSQKEFKEKFICVSTRGDVTYDWRDYNFKSSTGNILEMNNDALMEGYQKKKQWG